MLFVQNLKASKSEGYGLMRRVGLIFSKSRPISAADWPRLTIARCGAKRSREAGALAGRAVKYSTVFFLP